MSEKILRRDYQGIVLSSYWNFLVLVLQYDDIMMNI
jgi:hypothetical protein